jgi:hypothetical protein
MIGLCLLNQGFPRISSFTANSTTTARTGWDTPAILRLTFSIDVDHLKTLPMSPHPLGNASHTGWKNCSTEPALLHTLGQAMPVLRVESGCVILQSLVLSIRIMCKDLWKLLRDIYTSVLTEWKYESISYKPYITRREMPSITHHVSDISVVACLKRIGQIFTSYV